MLLWGLKMNRVIWLPLSEMRCIGAQCGAATPCARKEITYTAGRPQGDYSVSRGGLPECGYPVWVKHIPLSRAVKPADKPVVKEWIGR